jgi:uncharacterized protein (TIGR02118 family)
MIKVSVLYPNKPGAKFDMAYYCAKHMPMVQQKLGAACNSVAFEQGIAGAMPGSPPAFIAMGHCTATRPRRFRPPSCRTRRRSWRTSAITPTSNRRSRSAT